MQREFSSRSEPLQTVCPWDWREVKLEVRDQRSSKAIREVFWGVEGQWGLCWSPRQKCTFSVICRRRLLPLRTTEEELRVSAEKTYTWTCRGMLSQVNVLLDLLQEKERWMCCNLATFLGYDSLCFCRLWIQAIWFDPGTLGSCACWLTHTVNMQTVPATEIVLRVTWLYLKILEGCQSHSVS